MSDGVLENAVAYASGSDSRTSDLPWPVGLTFHPLQLVRFACGRSLLSRFSATEWPLG